MATATSLATAVALSHMLASCAVMDSKVLFPFLRFWCISIAMASSSREDGSEGREVVVDHRLQPCMPRMS